MPTSEDKDGLQIKNNFFIMIPRIKLVSVLRDISHKMEEQRTRNIPFFLSETSWKKMHKQNEVHTDQNQSCPYHEKTIIGKCVSITPK